MKRSLVLFIVVMVSALAPSTAAAYLLSAELLAFIASVPASNDFVAGEGKFFETQAGMAEQFNIAAHGSPANAKGHVRFNDAFVGEAHGDVDCLFVMGNQAGVSGHFDPNEPLGGQFPFFIAALEDNGEPNGVTQDRAVLAGVLQPVTDADCGLAEALIGGSLPIQQGNIVVKDR